MSNMSELDYSIKNNELDADYTQAVSLHRDILANAQLAAESLVELGKCLKEMRDRKLFHALGHATFEDYTVQMAGIKQRQAYTYITAYEKLGASFLQSNAKLGITKLQLLEEIPALEREEFMRENGIAEISVSELKKIVAERDAAQEQLSMFAPADEENETKPPQNDSFDQYIVERERLLAEIADLKEQLDEPVEASDEAVAKIRAEETARAARDAKEQIKQAEQSAAQKIKDARDKAQAKIQAVERQAKQETETAERRAQETARQQIADSLRDIEREKSEALTRAAELEKKLRVAANPDTVQLNFYLEALQDNFAKAIACIARVAVADPAAAERFRTAVGKLLDALRGAL